MINVENLNLRFNDLIVFDEFSVFIRAGEKVTITGESGRGKTTLLNLILGFIPGYSGTVEIDGMILSSLTVKAIRKKTAWLPQDTSVNFTSVRELLYTPFSFSENKKNKPDEEEIFYFLDKFQLDKKILDKKAKEISGGQKQRVLLISTLLLKKPVLILDEPTSALDENVKKAVTDHILQDDNITVLTSSHDEYWIENSDKIIEL